MAFRVVPPEKIFQYTSEIGKKIYLGMDTDSRLSFPNNPPLYTTERKTSDEGGYELINIPLQKNSQDEYLRGQKILITEYNKFKYSSNC